MRHSNEYANMLNSEFFYDCPKTVLAAIAVSLLQKLNGEFGTVTADLADEWRLLHQNGIVPQRCPKEWLR